MQGFDPNYRGLPKTVKPESNGGLDTNYATKCACPAIAGSPIRLVLKIFPKSCENNGMKIAIFGAGPTVSGVWTRAMKRNLI